MSRPARSYIKKKAAAPWGFAIIPVPASTNWCHAHTSHGAFLWLNLMPVTTFLQIQRGAHRQHWGCWEAVQPLCPKDICPYQRFDFQTFFSPFQVYTCPGSSCPTMYDALMQYTAQENSAEVRGASSHDVSFQKAELQCLLVPDCWTTPLASTGKV